MITGDRELYRHITRASAPQPPWRRTNGRSLAKANTECASTRITMIFGKACHYLTQILALVHHRCTQLKCEYCIHLEQRLVQRRDLVPVKGLVLRLALIFGAIKTTCPEVYVSSFSDQLDDDECDSTELEVESLRRTAVYVRINLSHTSIFRCR